MKSSNNLRQGAREIMAGINRKLNPRPVRRWNTKGILKSYRITPRGDRRFRREDVESFLRKQTHREGSHMASNREIMKSKGGS